MLTRLPRHMIVSSVRLAATCICGMQVAAAAASVGGGLAAVKGSLGSWGTYFKGQADKVGETVISRTGSPGAASRGNSQTASAATPAAAPAPAQRSDHHLTVFSLACHWFHCGHELSM